MVSLLQQLVYSSSVDIRPEWAVKDQIPFTALAKLNSIVPEVTDLAFHGSLRFYDKVPLLLLSRFLDTSKLIDAPYSKNVRYGRACRLPSAQITDCTD